MFDARARRLLAPLLEATGSRLADAGIPSLALTGLGWAIGVGACVAVAHQSWRLALVLWLANRMLDGLDGPVARSRGASDLGGFLDIVADFSIYAGFVVGVAVAVPEARLACVVLLTAYYVSGTAFLALSSLVERRGGAVGDGRSLRFVGGLAEGTETVVVYALICLVPAWTLGIVWVFTVAVALTAVQRVVLGLNTLRTAATAHPAALSVTAPDPRPNLTARQEEPMTSPPRRARERDDVEGTARGSGSTADTASPVRPGAPDSSPQPDPAGDNRRT
jgi:phosphatidylglycerophosphate synthase